MGSAQSCPGRAATLVVAVATAATVGSAGACDRGSGSGAPPMRLERVAPTPVMPGTRLRLRGAGFVAPAGTTLRVHLEGRVAGRRVARTVAPERVSDEELVVPVEGALAEALVPEAGRFEGRLRVRRRSSGPQGGGRSAAAGREASFPVRRTLTPSLSHLAPRELAPGAPVTVEGARYLHPEEGGARLELDGAFVPEDGGPVRELDRARVPLTPDDATRRDGGEAVPSPGALGLRPGTFEGRVRVANEPRRGPTRTSAWLEPGAIRLRAAAVDRVAPKRAPRGQWVDVHGRGLLPSDAAPDAGTLLVLEGTFTPDRGAVEDWTGSAARVVLAEARAGGSRGRFALLGERAERRDVDGLGAEPGVFDGHLRPVPFAGPVLQPGSGHELTLTVEPAVQFVELELLPGFDAALARFGLGARRGAVVEAMRAELARIYEGVAVRFGLEAPASFAAHGVVELAGRDPNGRGLLGLDNALGKDVGNERLDDVVGGFDPATRAEGFAAHGGVFVAEFMQFSSALADGPRGSARFDELFGPVAPELGGTPAAEPGAIERTARAERVARAARALGRLVGHTVAHEVGHTLGLPDVEGRFHHEGDNPGWLMDAGRFRPFEERVGIGGQGPTRLAPFNRSYLEAILPERAGPERAGPEREGASEEER